MTKLNLPSSTIKKIIDDPTLLGARLTGAMNSTSSPLSAIGISPDAADRILDGYNNGFRVVFIMNATLAAIATVVSILMIRHKELTRGDEVQLKARAKMEEKAQGCEEKDGAQNDVEMGKVDA